MARWFIISILFVAAAPLAAQDWKGMGRMEGRVLDPDGKPLADIVVKLDLPSRGGGTTVKTDKKGRWALAGITSGQWNLDIEAAGFEPKKLQVTLPAESARIPPVEIKLAKAVPKGPSPELLAAVEKGDTAYKAGKYAEARAEYEKVLALKPELANTLHELIARCYSQEGNYSKSLEHLQHLLDAEPANTNLRVLMAQEALRGNMLDKGMELLKGIDESTITNPEIFYNIGVIFVNNQKAEEAIGYFTKAVTADPKYVDGYFQRGLAYLQLQKMAECKADFKKVLELAPAGSPQADTAKKALEQLK
jgi:tetratricopeptide (TPR) repeat protein